MNDKKKRKVASARSAADNSLTSARNVILDKFRSAKDAKDNSKSPSAKSPKAPKLPSAKSAASSLRANLKTSSAASKEFSGLRASSGAAKDFKGVKDNVGKAKDFRGAAIPSVPKLRETSIPASKPFIGAKSAASASLNSSMKNFNKKKKK